MHTEPYTTMAHPLLITIYAYVALVALALPAWYGIMRLVLSINSGTFYGVTSAIIAAGLAIAALAFYWEHTD